MERRRKSTTPHKRGSREQEAATNVPNNSLPELPYINEIIELGAITIGIIPPLRECVAIAHEGRHTLAILKKKLPHDRIATTIERERLAQKSGSDEGSYFTLFPFSALIFAHRAFADRAIFARTAADMALFALAPFGLLLCSGVTAAVLPPFKAAIAP